VEQIEASPSLDVLYNSEVAEAIGTDRLEAVVVRSSSGAETRRIDTPAMFVFAGAVPHSKLVDGLVERDSDGFIMTGQQFTAGARRPPGWKLKRDPFLLETSVAGIFAAGDVRRDANRRVGSAVGDGGMAISFIVQYLRTV
jgi:thioredoxin reductase (NADPH)